MKLILIEAIHIFGEIFMILIFIRALLSWIPMFDGNMVYQIIYNLTEPVLGPIRNILYKSPLGGAGMMIDISPILSFILIQIVSNVLIKIITII